MNKPTSSLSDASVTRRSFLQTTSAIGAGTMLGGLTIERCAHAAGADKEFRVALVGCGGRGSGAADQGLNTHTEGKLKLVAMGDAHQDKLEGSLKQLVRKHGERVEVSPEAQFVGWDAYKKAIELCDVVILASPPGIRPVHFEEAVRQGKHIFAEKPIAVDGPGIRRFLAAAEIAKQKNLKVGIGLQRHHQPNYEQSVKRLQDGAVGDIVSMRAYWNGTPAGPKEYRDKLKEKLGRAPTEMEYQLRNWYMFNWVCGDHIVEQHIHNLDVINWIKNTHPVKCHGMGGRAYHKGPDSGEIFDHHAVEYQYADGSIMFSQCRQIPGTRSDVSEAVQGTKGTWDSRGFAIKDLKGDIQWRYKAAEGDSNDGHQMEHYPFFKAVRENLPYNEAVYGAHSTLTAIMGRMATYSGKEVTWEEAMNSKLDLQPESYSWDAKMKVNPGPDGNYPYAIPGKTVAL
jgi:predicted dehydrogenase